jgi:hypothetical protein
MKRLIYISIITCIVLSCQKDDDTINTCPSFFNTTELNLYTFRPFTEEEWKTMPHTEKVELRQVPNDFLEKMNNRELLVQFVTMDLANDILLFNAAQAGILASIERYNILHELYAREHIYQFFMESIYSIDFTEIKSNECHCYFFYLQLLSAQQQLISKIPDADLKDYVDMLYYIYEETVRLSYTDPSNWGVASSYTAPMLGFGIVMIDCNYLPFIELLESNIDVSRFMQGHDPLSEYVLNLINVQMSNFYKQLN